MLVFGVSAYTDCMPLSCVIQHIVLSIASDEHHVWRGHRKEAKRGPPCGPRVTRTSRAMMSFLHPCATPWLSLMAGRCAIGETHRGQQGTPALTLPHRRDGLRVLLMAVWCPCRRPSMCRPVHRPFMRNAWLDLTTIVPATPCHQRNDVETYSRSRQTRSAPYRITDAMTRGSGST